MIRMWQVMLLALSVAVSAAESEKAFAWKAPEIGAGLFSDKLGLLDREREEYATNLAVYASNRVAKARASVASLDEARRLLALAMHLSARNKKSLVVNYQLGRGIVPEAIASEYSSEVLARLLYTRAQMLRQQGGEENLLLARIFTELAAEMDPRNEDAVYASELQRLDHGRIDWKLLTDTKARAVEEGEKEDLP